MRCWACREVYEVGFANANSRIYMISDRLDNATEVYFCRECGKRLEEHNECCTVGE